MDEKKTNLLAFSREGLRAYLSGLGMKTFRADQVARWIYSEGLTSFTGMTNLSKADREMLGDTAEVRPPELLGRLMSEDGTEKYLFGMEDGEKVESVLIPGEDRLTLCISSQAGCALGCRFCLTGAGGFVRDLLPHEITGQVFMARSMAAPRVITNIVLMGTGEPLLNRDNVFEALGRLTDPKMFSISTRRITLSTAGVVPGLQALAESGLGVNLAVSLNAATDEVRDEIMPINRKYPISKLMAALRAFPLAPRRRITIEYVLLAGINDSAKDARALGKVLRGLKCKINLIPFNEHGGSAYTRPGADEVFGFKETLAEMGYAAFIRDSRGSDILAACGQLRAEAAGVGIAGRERGPG